MKLYCKSCGYQNITDLFNIPLRSRILIITGMSIMLSLSPLLFLFFLIFILILLAIVFTAALITRKFKNTYKHCECRCKGCNAIIIGWLSIIYIHADNLTNFIKIGFETLSAYILLSSFSLLLTLFIFPKPESIVMVLSFIISIFAIILWYEGIKNGMKHNMLNGVLVSLFYIIPYSLANFRFNIPNEKFAAQGVFILAALRSPMAVSIDYTIFETVFPIEYKPLLIMVALIAINIISNIINKKHTYSCTVKKHASE